jgi:hypothetical protein
MDEGGGLLMLSVVGRMRTVLRVTWPLMIVLLLLPIGSTAHAENIVSGSLDCSLDDGSLAGTTFTVVYSYDADQVAPEGESYVPLTSFDFTLLDARFTRDDIFQGGQVIFRDGALENVTASFQVRMPPNSPVKNITFGFGGPGVIGYIDLGDQFGNGSFTFE